MRGAKALADRLGLGMGMMHASSIPSLEFEHTVVNMFVIPTGMMMGAKITVAEWWLWNQIPVTLGNLVGGFIFTGLAIYITHKPRKAPTPLTMPTQVPAE